MLDELKCFYAKWRQHCVQAGPESWVAVGGSSRRDVVSGVRSLVEEVVESPGLALTHKTVL